MISIISWFGFMDVGLGHGLRNKFAVAKANGDHEKAKKYVSTTYAILFIIVGIFFLCFVVVNGFNPWTTILNVDENFNQELSQLALIVFSFFSLKFVAKLVTTIIVADQKPAVRDVVNLVSKIIILITIFLLTRTTTSSLIYVGLAYTGLPVLVLVLASFYFYNTTYRKYSPSIKSIDFSYAKDLIGLGWKFFVIQISVTILFTTDNIIISQLFGPAEVTPYQIANKYYGIVLMFFAILISPMWSAYTEAFEKDDFDWIKNVIRKQEKTWLLIILIVIGMTIIAEPVYKFWVGEEVRISLFLSACWGLFVILQTYNIIYTYFLNGVGMVKLQMITATISIFINIPLSIFFARTIGLGLPGVILATCVSIFIYSITRKIQVTKIINGNATGIWGQ
jgi:O-antigen/teichoic acid export membrane protein